MITRPRLTISALVLTVLLAGCAGFGGLENNDLQSEFEDRLVGAEVPEELEATQTTRLETPDGNESVTTRLWLRDDGTSRTEGVDDAYTIVDDGEQVWHHDLESDTATVLESKSTTESRLEGLYAQQERYLETFDVTTVEETTVDGRESYRVVFEPPANETLERSIDVLVGETIYQLPLETSSEPLEETTVERLEMVFDEETLFPVEYRLDAEELTFAVAYEDLAVDTDIDDGTFEFDPDTVGSASDSASDSETDTSEESESDSSPDESGDSDSSTDSDEEWDSIEEIVLPTITEYDTVEEAEDAVQFDVAEPPAKTLSENATLEAVSRYEFHDENRTQVSLFYRSGDETVSVTTGDRARGYAAGGESVDVDGVTGSIERTGQGTELEWECEGHHYSIFASDAFEDGTALEVADSIGCETA